jgi:hypothetical protein
VAFDLQSTFATSILLKGILIFGRYLPFLGYLLLGRYLAFFFQLLFFSGILGLGSRALQEASHTGLPPHARLFF